MSWFLLLQKVFWQNFQSDCYQSDFSAYLHNILTLYNFCGILRRKKRIWPILHDTNGKRFGKRWQFFSAGGLEMEPLPLLGFNNLQHLICFSASSLHQHKSTFKQFCTSHLARLVNVIAAINTDDDSHVRPHQAKRSPKSWDVPKKMGTCDAIFLLLVWHRIFEGREREEIKKWH